MPDQPEPKRRPAVKEVIYLVVSRHGVERMRKALPDLKHGEIPVKLVVEVDESAFREPVIERHVHVVDWREGIDIADLHMREAIITEKEAEMVRAQRLIAMRTVLEQNGYAVTPKEADTDTRPGGC